VHIPFLTCTTPIIFPSSRSRRPRGPRKNRLRYTNSRFSLVFLTSFLSDKLDLEPRKPRLTLLLQNLKLRSLNIQNVKSDRQEFPKILKSSQQLEEHSHLLSASHTPYPIIFSGALVKKMALISFICVRACAREFCIRVCI
jgi:hypothetical protein